MEVVIGIVVGIVVAAMALFGFLGVQDRRRNRKIDEEIRERELAYARVDANPTWQRSDGSVRSRGGYSRGYPVATAPTRVVSHSTTTHIVNDYNGNGIDDAVDQLLLNAALIGLQEGAARAEQAAQETPAHTPSTDTDYGGGHSGGAGAGSSWDTGQSSSSHSHSCSSSSSSHSCSSSSSSSCSSSSGSSCSSSSSCGGSD